jgi:formate dehydrogenase iron-sulfur subunit
VDVGAAVVAMDRWLFMSDVCKHSTNGLPRRLPHGALIRTEFQTVIIQPNVCNGCGYCIPSCPFGVPNRDPYDGRTAKCTLCYDRLQDGLEPAGAKAGPTDSIQFGPYDELVQTAKGRVVELHERGFESAYLYGAGDAPGEQLARGARRVLPAHRAPRALRSARARGLPDSGELPDGNGRRAVRGGACRAG